MVKSSNKKSKNDGSKKSARKKVSITKSGSKKRSKFFNKLKRRKPKKFIDLLVNKFIDYKNKIKVNYPTNINYNIDQKVKNFGRNEKKKWAPSDELKKYNVIYTLERPQLKYSSDVSIACAFLYIYGLQQYIDKIIEKVKGDKDDNKLFIELETIKNLFDREKKENYKIFKNEDFEIRFKKNYKV
jgi:hypothetical protein